MDIIEFFQLSVGKWFSQRSSHHFNANPSAAGTSDLYIDLLDKAEPEIVQLCETYQVDPALALCAARINWTETSTLSQKKPSGSTVLIPLINPDTPNQGPLLHNNIPPGINPPGTPPISSRYLLGKDESLTLITEQGTLYAEERIWFASPNLRLRTSVLKQPGGFSTASFCSEIRMMTAKPQ